MTPPESRLHMSLSALLSTELMIAVIIDEDNDPFLILTLNFNEFIFLLHCF